MRTVQPSLLAIAALTLMLGTQGCQLLLIPAAYGIGKAQERAAVKKTLETAPEVSHPVLAKTVEEVPSVGTGGTQFRIASFDGQQACFAFVGHASPEQVQQASYRLLSFRTPEETVDNVPAMEGGVATVTQSHRELRPVARTRTETIRGRDGQVIATVEKQVTELEAFYTTAASLCFAQPSIVTAESRYLMVQANREYAAWRLRSN
jgi:hypothetical protein